MSLKTWRVDFRYRSCTRSGQEDVVSNMSWTWRGNFRYQGSPGGPGGQECPCTWRVSFRYRDEPRSGQEDVDENGVPATLGECFSMPLLIGRARETVCLEPGRFLSDTKDRSWSSQVGTFCRRECWWRASRSTAEKKTVSQSSGED